MKKLIKNSGIKYVLLFLYFSILLVAPLNSALAATWGNNSSGINVTLNPNPSFDVTVTATRQESIGVTDNVDTNYDNGKWVIGPIESIGGSCVAGPTETDNTTATRKNTFLIEVKDEKTGKTVSNPAITTINFCGQNAPAFLDISITTVPVSQATAKGTVKGTLFYTKDDGSKIPFKKNAVAKLTCDGQESIKLKIDDSGKIKPETVSVKSPGGSTCILEATWKPSSTEDGTIPGVVYMSKTIKPGQTVDYTSDSVPPGDPSVNPNPGAAAEEEKEAACDNALSPFGWIMCPILDLADNVYAFFVGIVRDTLFFEPEKYNNSSLQEVSRIFTTFANVLLVIFALIMIASQIFGFEVFSAYTIKKVLPKLILGAIFIQLSWPIFTLMIQLVNAIGTGLYWLFMAPFASYMSGQNYVEIGAILGAGSDGTNEGTTALGLAGGAGIVVAGAAIATVTSTWLTIILAAIGILISLVVAILTLIVREVMLILLLAIAPLGLAMWVFPGTNKFWNMWWQNFSKLLMMYPIIMLLIASGSVAAIILSQASAPDSGIDINKIFAIVAYFAPIFMIGWSFKFAGQAFGIAGNLSSKWGDKARKSGMFGLRDQEKMRRENSAWNNIRANRKENLSKKLQDRSAQRITGTGDYEKGFKGLYSKRFVQSASRQGNPDNLIRAQARAGEQIQSEEAKAYKNRGSLVDFQVQSVAKRLKQEDPRLATTDLYEIEKNVRAGMLAGGETFDSDLTDASGHSIRFTGLPQIDDSLKEDVALSALANKDDTSQLRTYLADPTNFQRMKDRGTQDKASWGTLQDKFAVAAKGADSWDLSETGVNAQGLITYARGFSDTVDRFAGNAGTQQKQTVQALRKGLQSARPEDRATAAGYLQNIVKGPNIKQEHINLIAEELATSIDPQTNQPIVDRAMQAQYASQLAAASTATATVESSSPGDFAVR